MATTYNTAFGSLPGYNEMLGTTNTTGGGQQQTYGQTTQTSTTRPPYQAAQTFAQMQRQGVARPAPPTAPQAQPFAQYGGSQQAQQMRQRLQEQLQQFGQAPSRFDTQAFQQIRGAQQANLQAEFEEQQRKLNEDLARRGLSASTIGAAGLGRLAGAQSRALADIDTQLLQRAAETQAQDRAQLLAEGRGLAELASSQDLAQFEANRVAQAATFENQLRAAQFGQQQFEQAGQEAFQGAQAEQAADQFARQFGLQATGQAATLSMDLQRLLGQQEIERAGLTGQLGGAQTLAGREFAERQRQFDIQQALQEQLGLGGLGVQQEQLTVERERLAQQQADAAAERTLREKLQTAELTAQEKQQLADIDARKALQTQQLTEQAKQFGLDLKEREAARLQQGGFTTEELAIRRAQVDNELAIQNRRLSEEERNNLAIRSLEQDRFEADKDFRADQLNLNRDELEVRKDQIIEDQRLRGVEISDLDAYRTAELELRTTQITNENAIAGRQIGVDEARIQAQKDINAADNTAQMARLTAQIASQEGIATKDREIQKLQQAYQNAMRLSEQSGVQYTVSADGSLEVMKDANNNPMRTSAFTQSMLERSLREQLGMMEATGQAYTRDAGTGAVSLATGAQAARTIQAQQLAFQRAAQLSEQSGIQHEVKADGTVSPVIVNNQPVRTSAESRFNLDLQFRRQMGLMEQTGQAFNIDPATGQATLATGAEALSTLGRLQQNLQQAQIMSQITGQQFTVDANGNLVRGTADTEARRQFTLENLLRQTLGMSEATGYVYDPITGQRTSQETVQGQIARSQTLLSLANALGNLTPEQISQLLGKAPPTTGPTPPSTPREGDTKTEGGKTYVYRNGQWVEQTSPPGNPMDGDRKTENGKNYVYRGTWPNGQWVEQTSSGGDDDISDFPRNANEGDERTSQAGVTYVFTNGRWVRKTSTEQKEISTERADVVNSVIQGNAFDGRYYQDVNGAGWVTYKNGKWYTSNPPAMITVPHPDNPAVELRNVYPGYTTLNMFGNPITYVSKERGFMSLIKG